MPIVKLNYRAMAYCGWSFPDRVAGAIHKTGERVLSVVKEQQEYHSLPVFLLPPPPLTLPFAPQPALCYPSRYHHNLNDDDGIK